MVGAALLDQAHGLLDGILVELREPALDGAAVKVRSSA